MNYLGMKRRGDAPTIAPAMKAHDLLAPKPATPMEPKYPVPATGGTGVARRRSTARQSR